MAAAAHASDANERWAGPFGGSFNAAFTVTTDYSYAGISNSQLGPAFQVNVDYRTPDLIDALPLWLFVSAFGTNISFPASGPGVEIDIGGGLKLKALHDKRSADLGYVRYNYPGVPSIFSYDYGEIVANAAYDFDLFELKARLRYSLNSFGNSGESWNKRALSQTSLHGIFKMLISGPMDRWVTSGWIVFISTAASGTTGIGRSAGSPSSAQDRGY